MTAIPNNVLIRTHELLEILIDDVNKGYEILERDKDSQFLRRVVFRNVFSFIEGMVHIVKFELKSYLKKEGKSIKLTPKEREILYEQKIKNGEKINLFIPIEKNLYKTFKLAEKVWQMSNYSFSFSDNNRQFLISAKNKRNKLMHPRTYYDMQISDVDMANISSTYLYLKDEFNELIKARMQKIENEISNEFY